MIYINGSFSNHATGFQSLQRDQTYQGKNVIKMLVFRKVLLIRCDSVCV